MRRRSPSGAYELSKSGQTSPLIKAVCDTPEDLYYLSQLLIDADPFRGRSARV